LIDFGCVVDRFRWCRRWGLVVSCVNPGGGNFVRGRCGWWLERLGEAAKI
jgi:hypothetical protein